MSSGSESIFMKGASSKARIRSVRDYIGKVELPLRPGHYVNDIVLDVLIKRDRFPHLCEAAFGPLLVHDPVPPMCWLDEANNDPQSEIATELFELLKPDGLLFGIMQEVSAPSSEFRSLLGSKKWKSATHPTDVPAPYGASFTVSLSLLGSKVADNVEAAADLAAVDHVPPGLLVPYWFPPIVHTPEAPVIADRETIHCTMLGYFLIRLALYGAERAHAAPEDILRVPHQPQGSTASWVGEGIGNLVVKIEQQLSKWTKVPKAAVTFPFYQRLLQAYTSHFVKPATLAKIVRSKSFNDIQWSLPETTAAELALLPTQIWLRAFISPQFECNRSPIIDADRDRSLMIMARLAIAADYLRTVYLALVRAVPLTGDEQPLPRSQGPEGGTTGSTWVHRIHRHVERTSMIVIRQMALSLPRLPCVRGEHLRNVVELWTCLTKSLTTNELVQRHYEAVSLFTDVLRMLSETSIDIDKVLNEPLGGSICAALDVLAMPSVTWLLQELEQAAKSRKMNTDGIRAFYLLDWSDSGNDEVASVKMAAATFANRLYGKLQRSSVLQLSKARKDVMESLANIFPGCVSQPDDQPTEGTQSALLETALRTAEDAKTSAARVQQNPIMTAEERALFLRGRGTTRWSPEARRIRFARETFLEPAGPISNEFPILLPAVEVIDGILDIVQCVRFRGRLPLCLNGHFLRLVDSDLPTCSQHLEHKAIWHCPSCSVYFGLCCRNHQPRDFDGGLLHRTVCGDRTCDRCFFALIGPNRLAYENSDTKNVLCNYCASEPYPKLSSRWIASYSATLSLIGLVLVYAFFAFVIENI